MIEQPPLSKRVAFQFTLLQKLACYVYMIVGNTNQFILLPICMNCMSKLVHYHFTYKKAIYPIGGLYFLSKKNVKLWQRFERSGQVSSKHY